MRRLTLLLSILVVVSACGGDNGTSATTEAPPPTQPETTEPGTAGTPEATEPPATTEPEAGAFALAAVHFGPQGGVAVKNVGAGPESVGGLAICQRPNYGELPDVMLQPGEVIWFSTGDPSEVAFDAGTATVVRVSVGQFSPTSGEIGLYRVASFGNSEAILSYVEWGGTGHGRSSVAVRAGIWPDGGEVGVPEGTVAILATSDIPIDPQEWAAQS